MVRSPLDLFGVGEWGGGKMEIGFGCIRFGGIIKLVVIMIGLRLLPGS